MLQVKKIKRTRIFDEIKEDELIIEFEKYGNKSEKRLEKTRYLYVRTDSGIHIFRMKDWNELNNKHSFLAYKYIQEARIFNEQEEIMYTRKGEKFIIRKCTDTKGDTDECIDEMHKVWGKVAESDQDKKYSILKDQRGSVIKLPAYFERGKKVAFIYRKYISIQAYDFALEQPFSYTIDDARLVKFCEFTGGEKSE